MNKPKYYVGQQVVFGYTDSDSLGMGMIEGAEWHDDTDGWQYSVKIGTERNAFVGEDDIHALLVPSANKDQTGMIWQVSSDDGSSRIVY